MTSPAFDGSGMLCISAGDLNRAPLEPDGPASEVEFRSTFALHTFRNLSFSYSYTRILPCRIATDDYDLTTARSRYDTKTYSSSHFFRSLFSQISINLFLISRNLSSWSSTSFCRDHFAVDLVRKLERSQECPKTVEGISGRSRRR